MPVAVRPELYLPVRYEIQNPDVESKAECEPLDCENRVKVVHRPGDYPCKYFHLDLGKFCAYIAYISMCSDGSGSGIRRSIPTYRQIIQKNLKTPKQTI